MTDLINRSKRQPGLRKEQELELEEKENENLEKGNIQSQKEEKNPEEIPIDENENNEEKNPTENKEIENPQEIEDKKSGKIKYLI